MDPTSAGHLLTGTQQDRWSNGGARGLRAEDSTDGGHHWKGSLPQGVSQCTGGRLQRSTDAWTGFGLDGTAYFFSLAFNNNPTPNIEGESATIVNRSTDGGLTWGAPTYLIDDTDPLAFNDKNSLTADPNIAGNAYAVWDRLYGPATAFRAPGGSDEHGDVASLGGNAAAAPDGVQMARNHLAALRANAAGTATPAVAAQALQETFGPTYFARTINSGVSWSRAVPIYDPGVFAQTIGNVIVGTPSGEIIDFFDHITAFGNLSIDFVRSKDHGLSWSKHPETATPITGAGAVTPDTQQPIRSEDIIFSVTADQVTGNLYVLWQDIPSSGAQLSVLFSQSTDDGKTWSAPVKVNQTPASSAQPFRGQGFNGTVAAVANGALVVTYYDFRNDTFAGGHELTDAWVVFCLPGSDCTQASSWGHEARLTPTSFDITQAPLTNSGFFLGDYFGLATQGTDAWPAFTAVTGPGQTALFTRPIHLGAVTAAK